MDYSNVLVKNYPGTSWKMENASDYDTLEWYDETPKPSKDALDTKLIELQNAEPMRLLRIERDRRIVKTDWRASVDLTISNDWKAYRQALRDLPASANPTLNSNGMLNMSSVTWPTEPT
tara:strand:- start:50 stop:406 length:357 start_codon:yes stop_codon:yes gene_type:complete